MRGHSEWCLFQCVCAHSKVPSPYVRKRSVASRIENKWDTVCTCPPVGEPDEARLPVLYANYQVSILVLMDVPHRQKLKAFAKELAKRFQSLLFWIRLVGCLKWESSTITPRRFNPCCSGFASSAIDIVELEEV